MAMWLKLCSLPEGSASRCQQAGCSQAHGYHVYDIRCGVGKSVAVQPDALGPCRYFVRAHQVVYTDRV